MTKFIHLKKEQQQLVPLFNGAFIENKPIPFPDMGTTTAYSNLFYWANLEAFETSEFPLHPHEGFEIMTFVFKGSIEHYDTATKIWTPMKAGGVQVIQAGSGIEHSERITKGTQLFQIWFDPDFSKTLNNNPTYKNYHSSEFNKRQNNGIISLSYVNIDGPINSETNGLEVEKLSFSSGKYSNKLDKDYTYSYYLLEGNMKINNEIVVRDDFLAFKGIENINFIVDDIAELFVIKTPSTVNYPRFLERYK